MSMLRKHPNFLSFSLSLFYQYKNQHNNKIQNNKLCDSEKVICKFRDEVTGQWKPQIYECVENFSILNIVYIIYIKK